MLRKIPVDLIVGLLVLLFAYTGVSKLVDFQEFSGQMRNQPLPRWLTDILTFAVPVSEFVVTVILLLKPVRHYGLLLSSLLLMAFTVYTGLILIEAFDYIPCACAGIFENMSWSTHLIVNVSFTGLALLGFLSGKKIRATRLPERLYRDTSA